MPIGDTLRQQSQYYLGEMANQSNPLEAMAKGAQSREEQMRQFYLNKILNNLGFEKNKALEMMRQQGAIDLEGLRTGNRLKEIDARTEGELKVRATMTPYQEAQTTKTLSDIETDRTLQERSGSLLMRYRNAQENLNTGNATNADRATLMAGYDDGKVRFAPMSAEEIDAAMGITPEQPYESPFKSKTDVEIAASNPNDPRYNEARKIIGNMGTLTEQGTPLDKEEQRLIEENREFNRDLTGTYIAPKEGGQMGTDLSGESNIFGLGAEGDGRKYVNPTGSQSREYAQQKIEENNRKLRLIQNARKRGFTGTAEELYEQAGQQGGGLLKQMDDLTSMIKRYGTTPQGYEKAKQEYQRKYGSDAAADYSRAAEQGLIKATR